LISVSNLSVQFGHKVLFKNASFIINLKDRIGFVGSNGTGKSTLLKILNGEIEPDSGSVSKSKHTTVDYLPQEGLYFTGKTLYDEIYDSISDIANVKNEIDEIQNELSEITDKESEQYIDLIDRLGELQFEYDNLEGYKIKSVIEKVLMGLGFKVEEFESDTSTFSGGWQMRIALAKLLIKNPSILLLDEPTNHLDLESLLWLEKFLINYQGAVVLVSHDRSFLDNITKKTVEISNNKVNIYSGNYSFYEKEKESRTELTKKRYLNQQKYLKQQNRFIERFRYKNTKATAVQSRIKMLDKLEKIEIEDEESKINFNFLFGKESGKSVFNLLQLSKYYGEKLILDKIDLEITRGERIGLVGVNGAGKSTLARIIIGTEPFQSGSRTLGYNVELESYSQHQADSLNPVHTVFETLEEIAEGDIRKKLRTLLGCFLFKGDDVDKGVSVLSGGEKSRLALARMLLKPTNFLILDEPTNHLDMRSKRVLLKALQNYLGTVLIISHDREFLDGVVTKIIEVKNHSIKTYYGNCSYYISKIQEESEAKDTSFKSADDENLPQNLSRKTKEQKRIEAEARNQYYKLTKPLKKSLDELEKNIIRNEKKLSLIEQDMNSEEFYKNQEHVKEKLLELKNIKQELELQYREWESLSYKLHKIETQIN
jgi:ATP-binding cassette, subfamily F, member 3